MSVADCFGLYRRVKVTEIIAAQHTVCVSSALLDICLPGKVPIRQIVNDRTTSELLNVQLGFSPQICSKKSLGVATAPIKWLTSCLVAGLRLCRHDCSVSHRDLEKLVNQQNHVRSTSYSDRSISSVKVVVVIESYSIWTPTDLSMPFESQSSSCSGHILFSSTSTSHSNRSLERKRICI